MMMGRKKKTECGVCERNLGGRVLCGRCADEGLGEARSELSRSLKEIICLRHRAAEVMGERRRDRGGRGRERAPPARLFSEKSDSPDFAGIRSKLAYEIWQKVAHGKLSNEKKRLQLSAARKRLEGARESEKDCSEALCEGLLRNCLEVDKEVRYVQLRRVLDAFVLIPVDVSMPLRTATPGELSGVSEIAGIPLPNDGVYDNLPDIAVAAALRLISRLVVALGSYLDTPLPHPVLADASAKYAEISPHLSLNDAEHESWYPLHPGEDVEKRRSDSSYSFGLDLLRHNVLHLCVEGGRVPLDCLWPAEALLANLGALKDRVMDELDSLENCGLLAMFDK